MSSTVYINGISVEFMDCFTLRQFFASLSTEEAIVLLIKKRRKVLEFKISGNEVFGIVFTDTEQSSYVTIDVKNNRVVAKVEQLDGGNTRHDFTFFRINLDTGNGIYSQYRGSGGMMSFAYMLNLLYKRQAKIVATKIEGVEKPDEERIHSLKRAYLKADHLVPNHDFYKELEKLSKVYQFGFSEPSVNEPRMRVLRGRVEVAHHRYIFQKDFRHDKVAHAKQIAKEILTFIAGFVKNSRISHGVVIGKDHNNEHLEIPIEPDVLAFGKEDYDKVAAIANFSLNGRFDGPFPAMLNGIMQSHRKLFNAKRSAKNEA